MTYIFAELIESIQNDNMYINKYKFSFGGFNINLTHNEALIT